MKFGSHVSIRDGYLGAAQSAKAMNAASFQFFPKNPRGLTVKAFDKVDAKQCKEFCIEQGLVSIAHTPYPTTLTPTDDAKRRKVIVSLLNDLEIADTCGAIGTVVHLGKSISPDPLESYRRMIDMLDEVLEKWEGNCLILLENNAGVPGSIGTTMEELVKVRELCKNSAKLGFCLDTCHAFASGLWNGENWGEVLEKGNRLGYFDHLKAVHLNNSKYASGSGKDRHANIFNDGFIKENHFDSILTSKLQADIPFILETPKEKISHQQEIELLNRKWSTKS
ncbi:deoxyribonuclease IV [Thalassobacillus hwangdonensis]|uniref:Deoxyribonuclease IV n=1 Tax=Thalassobacillus hwangdonensis TaxID=546108 RepID=A0ABW3L0D7_9BACI